MARARKHRKHGFIIALILVGIALFAAVSAAMVYMGKGQKNIAAERASLRAQSIMRYSAQVKDAVDVLYKQGVSENDLRFAHPALAADYGDIAVNPQNQVFLENAGGIAYTPPPPEAMNNTALSWEFFGTSAAPQVGTSAADLVMVLPNITLPVCEKINALAGFAAPTTIPTDDATDSKCVYTNTAADRFAGAFKTGGDINDMGTTGFTVLPAYQACVSCSGTYHYYKVLIER